MSGSVFVADFEKDMDAVAISARDYADRFRTRRRARPAAHPQVRPLLRQRDQAAHALGRRLHRGLQRLAPCSIPPHIKELVFVIKRFHQPDGYQRRRHFSVDLINGRPANELRHGGRKVVVNTLRVGFSGDGSWRVFGLRHDFHPVKKVQLEDDITASIVVPAHQVAQALLPPSQPPAAGDGR
jgi:hypothetical protein